MTKEEAFIAKYNGYVFENKAYNTILQSGYFSHVMREKDVKARVRSDITTIDILAFKNPITTPNNVIIAVQCKFTEKPSSLNYVKAFIRDCEAIEKIYSPAVFHLVYFSKSKLSKNSIKILSAKNTVENVIAGDMYNFSKGTFKKYSIVTVITLDTNVVKKVDEQQQLMMNKLKEYLLKHFHVKKAEDVKTGETDLFSLVVCKTLQFLS